MLAPTYRPGRLLRGVGVIVCDERHLKFVCIELDERDFAVFIELTFAINRHVFRIVHGDVGPTQKPPANGNAITLNE